MTDHVIASPSRDSSGNLTTPGAKFVGEIESVIEHGAKQLVLQAIAKGEELTHEAARALVQAEIATGVKSAEVKPKAEPAAETTPTETPAETPAETKTSKAAN